MDVRRVRDAPLNQSSDRLSYSSVPVSQIFYYVEEPKKVNCVPFHKCLGSHCTECYKNRLGLFAHQPTQVVLVTKEETKRAPLLTKKNINLFLLFASRRRRSWKVDSLVRTPGPKIMPRPYQCHSPYPFSVITPLFRDVS